jgi:ribosomal protein L11 methyltransferase
VSGSGLPSAEMSKRPPAWIEVSVVAPLGWCELVAEALALGPCTSVAFGATSLGSETAPEGWEHVRTFVPEVADTTELRARLTAALAALAERTGAEELAGLAPRFQRLPPEDYANSWRKSWRPFRVGDLAVVSPDWRGTLRARDRVLRLEPGGAFGTGRHPTTRACLRFLQGWPLADARVLDAGTGSGVLAVAALLWGAREAFGFDVDPHAVPYAEALALDNGVAARCRFAAAGMECLAREREPFDALFANLYADLILAHAGLLARALRPGARFAVSGCVRARRAEVEAALEAAGLEVRARAERGRWDAFAGRRR